MWTVWTAVVERVESVGLKKAATDSQGFFRLSDLVPAEHLDLEVWAEGFVPRRVSTVSAPATGPLNIVLATAARISGRVVGTDGSALARAVVTASHPASAGGASVPEPRVTATDEDGKYRFGNLEPGQLRVTAQYTGYRQGEPGMVDLVAGQQLDEIELVLEPGTTVAGRISTPHGEGVADARVTATAPGEGTVLDMTTTGASGSYRLEGLAQGELQISVYHDLFLPRGEGLQAGAGENHLDLELDPGLEVSYLPPRRARGRFLRAARGAPECRGVVPAGGRDPSRDPRRDSVGP